MTIHVYPRAGVYKDYAWVVAGLFLAGVPLFLVKSGSIIMWVLSAAIALFAAYGYTTFRRQFTWFQTDSHGVKGRALSNATFLWRDIEGVKLAYYTTRRDKTKGWMTLTIRTRTKKFSIESTISDFNALAEGAFKAAIANHVVMDETTLGNFEAIGLTHEEGMRGRLTPEIAG